MLALMNWMSKGDRATAPFSQELSKSECVNGALGENHKLVGKHFGSRTAEVCSRTQVSIPFLKIILIRNVERSESFART